MAGSRRARLAVSSRRLSAARRGLTLMELLVVLAILLILTSSLVSGYNNMQRAQKINRANEALINTLNLTRNLAISTNSVTYLEIVGVDPTANLTVGSAKAQVMKIHVFPNPADALTVTGEPGPNGSQTNTYSSTPANLVVLAPNAWSPSSKQGYVEPLSVAYQDPPAPAGTVIPGTGQAYNNYQSEMARVEPGTMIGCVPSVLPFDATTGSSPILIGFNPDGTLIPPPVPPPGTPLTAVRLYVTDDPAHWYGPLNPANDTALQKALSPTNANGTPNGAPKPVPHLKVIEVFGGGLIKQEM